MTGETHSRSIAKALSWRVIALGVTTSVGYGVTGKLEYAAAIGLVDSAIKIFAYYGHERIWGKIRFGNPAMQEFNDGSGI